MKTNTRRGDKFGRLFIVGFTYIVYGTRKLLAANCVCDCGRECTVPVQVLKDGRVKSCGCLRREVHNVNVKHGEARTRLYKIWCCMKERCGNTHHVHFKDYGGRGIKVCAEWMNYTAFASWAKENGYSDSLSIDRIDNSCGYSPDNCRWVSAKKQANNRNTNHLIAFGGHTHTISEWAKITGIGATTIRQRLHRGWTVGKALGK